ncbi:MAG TPA: DUF992 domain-containing protein [Rhizomicrobium sp.]|nr:DUF992 domain-containing protein [Rhizomicrobium sp.]
MLKRIAIAAAAASLIVAGALMSADTQAEPSVKAGVLLCNVSSGWGFVFGSSRDVRCTYQAAAGGQEFYAGHISKFGVDIGYTRAGVMLWAVFAPTSTLKPGSLAGQYAGATVGATVGVGAGVNALIGGLKHSVALQPVSIEGNMGINVAAGVAEMTLHFRY